MNFEIGNPQLIWLMVFVPVLFALTIYSGWSRRRALTFFGSKVSRFSVLIESISGLLLALGVALLVLACMDIRWGKTTREVPQKGLEVVFALDVSRSMLAQDAKPNRLARAKQQIKDMIAEMAGDRIGLVVFAGEAVQSVPLTNHYDDFCQTLDEVGPHSVSRGGSQLGIAIKSAAESFISKTNEYKTIVLFTDGEDQESQPLKLARQLHAESGLRIFTVGLGDMVQGARIPDDNARTQQFIEYEGQQVWSKLNGSILKQIATETKAAYIPAGTKRVNMADIYYNYIANLEKSEFETAKIKAFVPRFQWFAFPAFVLLSINVWWSTRQAKQNRQTRGSNISVRPAKDTGRKKSSVSNITKAASFALMLLPSSLFAQSTEPSLDESIASKINAANELVRKDESEKAIEAFNQIEVEESVFQDELNYNLASAHYRNSDFAAANALFEQTAKSSNDRIASDSRYNLGNCHFANALPLTREQPQAAIGELEQAVRHYRSALRLDRQRSDARENVERAWKLIQKLRDQQEQKKDEQKKDEQEKGEQEKGEQEKGEQKKDEQEKGEQEKGEQEKGEQEKGEQEKGEQEKGEQEKGEQEKGEQEKGEQEKGEQEKGEQEKGEQEKGEQEKGEQEKGEQEKGEQEKGEQEQGEQEQGEQEKGEQEQGEQEQGEQEKGEQGQNKDGQDQGSNRPQAGDSEDPTSTDQGEPKQSDGAESQEEQRERSDNPADPQRNSGQPPDSPAELDNERRADSQTDRPESEEQASDGEEPPEGDITATNKQELGDSSQASPAEVQSGAGKDLGMMSKQEALKLLQAVRDRDMLRRLNQQQRQFQRRIKVDEDW